MYSMSSFFLSPAPPHSPSQRFVPVADASCCETMGERFESALRSAFTAWGSFCVRQPALVVLTTLVLVAAASSGLVYMRITTDPVDLWAASGSRARQEKAYFDEHFGPFFRTEQMIITTPINDTFIYSPYFGGADVPFGAIFRKDILYQVGGCVCVCVSLGEDECMLCKIVNRNIEKA